MRKGSNTNQFSKITQRVIRAGRIDQNHPRDFIRISFCEGFCDQTTKRMAYQNVRPFFTGELQCQLQVIRFLPERQWWGPGSLHA